MEAMAMLPASTMNSVESSGGSSERKGSSDTVPGLAFLPLTIAIVITLVLTIYPLVLSKADGKADHLAATLLFWAMSAGFVRGVGFVPKNRLLRLLLSSAACILMLALAVALVARRSLV